MQLGHWKVTTLNYCRFRPLITIWHANLEKKSHCAILIIDIYFNLYFPVPSKSMVMATRRSPLHSCHDSHVERIKKSTIENHIGEAKRFHSYSPWANIDSHIK